MSHIEICLNNLLIDGVTILLSSAITTKLVCQMNTAKQNQIVIFISPNILMFKVDCELNNITNIHSKFRMTTINWRN